MIRLLSKCIIRRLVAIGLLSMSIPAHAQSDAPSRAPFKGCKWEKLADASVGLATWAQRCDYGFRKVNLEFKGSTLAVRFSDGGEPSPAIDVFDLLPGERVEAGVKRIFAAHTDKALVARCVLSPDPGVKPAGAKRYTFVPNPAYRKELKAKAKPDEIGDPPCGDWGIAPDGIQYFEAWPAGKVRKVLFVRAGQEEPLFDEKTLQLIAPRE